MPGGGCGRIVGRGRRQVHEERTSIVDEVRLSRHDPLFLPDYLPFDPFLDPLIRDDVPVLRDLVVSDKVAGLRSQDVGLIAVEGLFLAVDTHRGACGVARKVAEQRVPIVPARRYVLWRVAVTGEVLADQRRPVSASFQPGGDGGLVASQPIEALETATLRVVHHYTVVLRVLAAQHCGPRRTTQRVGHEGVLELYALVRQQVFHPGHVLDRLGIQVVRYYQDYVRTGGRLGDVLL